MLSDSKQKMSIQLKLLWFMEDNLFDHWETEASQWYKAGHKGLQTPLVLNEKLTMLFQSTKLLIYREQWQTQILWYKSCSDWTKMDTEIREYEKKYIVSFQTLASLNG
jgi:hypothetical protein